MSTPAAKRPEGGSPLLAGRGTERAPRATGKPTAGARDERAHLERLLEQHPGLRFGETVRSSRPEPRAACQSAVRVSSSRRSPVSAPSRVVYRPTAPSGEAQRREQELDRRRAAARRWLEDRIPVAETATRSREPLGAIAGTVEATVSESPIEGIMVNVFDVAGGWVNSGTTDSAGAYLVGDLPAGDYFVVAHHPEWLNEVWDDVSCTPSCDPTIGTAVPATSGATTGGIDFQLSRAALISGTVTEAGSGTPLFDIGIEAFNSAGDWVTRTGTDPDGHFLLESLPPDTYKVRTLNGTHVDEYWDDVVCEPGWCDPMLVGAPVVADAGTTTTGIDFQLVLGGAIEGTVKAAGSSLPLQGVAIDLFDAVGEWVGGVESDENGEYRLGGLLAGDYFVTSYSADYLGELFLDLPCANGCDVTLGTPVSVALGTGTGGIDFELEPAGAIEGTVTFEGSGVPLADVLVSVYDGAGTMIGGAPSAADGTYRVPTLPAGSAFARTDGSPYVDELYDGLECEPECDVLAGTAIDVTAGATTSGIDFAIGTGATISGSVVLAGALTPISDLEVNLYLEKVGGGMEWIGVTNTAADGGWELGGLVAGTYRAQTSSVLYLDEVWDDIVCEWECDVAAGSPIAVAAGADVSGVDFELGLAGRIAGVVVDDDSSAPIDGAQVRIWGFDGSDWSPVADAWSGPDGGYEAGGMVDGIYVAHASRESYLGEMFDDMACEEWECDFEAGTPVAVVVGATTPDIDFALQLGGSITGTVTADGSALALPYRSVWLDNQSRTRGWYAQSNSEGRFELHGLPTDSYWVSVEGDDYLSELYDDVRCDPYCIPEEESEADLVPVIAGETVGGVDFALALGGTISGAIVEAGSGVPIPWARFEVYDSSGREYTSEWGNADENGQYAARGLVSELYGVTAIGDGYVRRLYADRLCPDGEECDPGLGDPVAVTEGAEVTDVNLALVPAGSISGFVRDATTGDPVGAYVYLIHAASGAVWYAQVDETGFYEFPGLSPGSYHLRSYNSHAYLDEAYDDQPCVGSQCAVDTGTTVSVAAGQGVSGIDFDLAPGARVEGTVEHGDGGGALEGAIVQIFDSAGDWLTQAVADEGGHFVSNSGLLPGSYHAYALAWGHVPRIFQDDECFPRADCEARVVTGVPIVATSGEPAPPAVFELHDGGGISGTVQEAGSGTPIPWASVSVYTASGERVATDQVEDVFTIGGWDALPTGTYYAVARDQTHLPQLYSGAPCFPSCDVALGAPIEVTAPASTDGVAFELAPAPTIGGRVGKSVGWWGVTGATILIFDVNGEFVGDGWSGWRNGLYQCSTGLEPGFYFAIADAEGFVAEAWQGWSCPFGACWAPFYDPIMVDGWSPLVSADFTLGDAMLAGDGFESTGFGAWDRCTGCVLTCAHPFCVTGEPLNPACDPCVTQIVAGRSSCASTAWDEECVLDTYRVCELSICETD